ncbi:hypothetical protein [Flavobacterium sp. Root420]|uniref:hypothetical protein n=1 Tax=Flavobacterium sp. Root420 TaxID=1736533 RepID=UPI000ABF7C06|nr:hypothetical protein [Flavobacterium sp. Root420]
MKKNLKKTILLSITLLMLSFMTLKAQSLNPTSSISAPGSADLFKGGYTFAYATSGTPWNGALLSYGGFAPNNYDTQISSDYGPQGGSHISYRTKNGDINTWNPWNELATRGANVFTGDQSVYGGIASSASGDLGGYLSLINTSKGSSGTAVRWTIYNMTSSYGNSLQFWAYDNLSCAGGLCNNRFTIMDNGNIGIGTTNPTSKLTVAGNINSREVKVTVDAGADFVFENNYNLPSLDAVDKYIKENKHLPEIASADQMKKDGINLSEMNIKLLQKIEELTLYSIEQQKNTENLTKVIETLAKRLEVVERK